MVVLSSLAARLGPLIACSQTGPTALEIFVVDALYKSTFTYLLTYSSVSV